jgi:hypothetical protein
MEDIGRKKKVKLFCRSATLQSYSSSSKRLRKKENIILIVYLSVIVVWLWYAFSALTTVQNTSKKLKIFSDKVFYSFVRSRTKGSRWVLKFVHLYKKKYIKKSVYVSRYEPPKSVLRIFSILSLSIYIIQTLYASQLIKYIIRISGQKSRDFWTFFWTFSVFTI